MALGNIIPICYNIQFVEMKADILVIHAYHVVWHINLVFQCSLVQDMFCI